VGKFCRSALQVGRILFTVLCFSWHANSSSAELVDVLTGLMMVDGTD
jgi:hypothetical protein